MFGVSVVVTAHDFESCRLASNPDWGQYSVRLRSLHGVYPSFHPSEVVDWVTEQLNIKAVTGACKLIDGCSIKSCVRPHLQLHLLAYALEI